MRTTRLNALAALTLTLALVAGCSNEAGPDAPDASASSESPGSAEGESGQDEGAAEDAPTSAETLAPDYPKRDVPLVKGNLLQSGTAQDRYTVTVLVPGKPKAAFDRVVRRLEGRGLEVKQSRSVRAGSVAVLTSPRYRVEVAAIPAGAQTSVTYVVQRRG